MTAFPSGGNAEWLTMWAYGQPAPSVSTLDASDGNPVSNLALVPAGSGGYISMQPNAQMSVTINVVGYFVPLGDSGGDLFYPVSPCRAVDTRYSQAPTLANEVVRSFAITGCSGVPSSGVYSLNLTVLPDQANQSNPSQDTAEDLAYLTAWSAGGQQPGTWNVTSWAGKVVAAANFVQAGSGSIWVCPSISPTSDTTELIVDVNGYFAPAPQYQITVTANPSNGGTVILSLNGVVQTPGSLYDLGAVVQVSATPSSGYQFSFFTSPPSPTQFTQNPLNVTVTGPTTVQANFTSTQPPPQITGLSVYSGLVSSAVTITGANFGASQGTSTVAFNGTPAPVIYSGVSSSNPVGTPSWSNNSISVTVPNGATSGSVVVNVGGVASSGVGFTVTPTKLGTTAGGASTSLHVTLGNIPFSWYDTSHLASQKRFLLGRLSIGIERP